MNCCKKRQLVLEYRDDGRRLALSFLRRWGCYCEPDDVFSAVDLALCEAARTYDPEYGTLFTTHAYLFVKNRIFHLAKWERERRRQLSYDPRELDGEDSVPEAIGFGKDEPHAGAVWENAQNLRPDSLVYRTQLLAAGAEHLNRLPALEAQVIRSTMLDGRDLTSVAEELGFSTRHLSRLRLQGLRTLRAQMNELE